jgi:Na+-driven multidrug efflux pump
MAANEPTGTTRWPQRRQDIAAGLWASFLIAAASSVLCFAFVDPAELAFLPDAEETTAGRMTGYAVGFFFLWIVAAASSALTLFLARTERPDAADPEQR